MKNKISIIKFKLITVKIKKSYFKHKNLIRKNKQI